jgi:biotin transport system substrate-specific component
MGLYLLMGVFGLPVFAGGASGNPLSLTSGGFIVGFVAAAALVGWLAQREWDRRFAGAVVSFAVGTLVIYGFGLPWLFASFLDLGPAVWSESLGYGSAIAATVGAGVIPFVLGDLLKALVAGALLPIAWRAIR